MGRLEVSCRRFAILSGVEQDAGDYAVCVHPSAPALQRKGALAVITETAGSHPSSAIEACRLTQRVVVESYFADSALSLTSSLLNALDHANTALLQYNYSSPDSGGSTEVAVQSGSVKPRRAKVGATAVLIRPDGAGIYLSQMSPTQAYIFHNGILSAIPEPAAWKQSPQHSVALMSGAQGGIADVEEEDATPDLSSSTLPSPSLGSGPGIEADLVYRRVEAGDMVVLVSTSLARYLDRDRAEQIISRHDADGVINALYNIATENALAEAHACVLELGVTDSSGVDEDYEAPVKTQQSSHSPAPDAQSTPPSTQSSPTIKDVLRNPRDWFQRRKLDPSQALEAAAPIESVQPDTTEPTEPGITAPEADEEAFWSRQPTRLFPQRPADIPPYQAAQRQPAPDTGNDAWGDWSNEELQFDGWEDAPPALDDPRYDDSHKILFKPKSYTDHPADDLHILGDHALEMPTPATSATSASQDDSEPYSAHSRSIPFSRPGSKSDIRDMTASAASWLLTTTRSLLPERISTGILAPVRSAAGRTFPLRILIILALVFAAMLFTFSVLSMAGNTQKAATTNLLQEAQQLETLANQPGLLAADRLDKLQLALAKAQEAVTASPQSPEAGLLVTKIQNELDQAQGITRFASVKPLFDLDAAGKLASDEPPTSASTAAGDSISGTLAIPINDIIVQSNDAFILDRASNKLYRCQLASAACSVLLASGDSAGGRQVGTITNITTRVGSLVAIDDHLVSYVLAADTGAWQAETLGDADALQAPKDIATYDGNLYLLESRAGQISKYLSGQYAQPPLNWISDEPTIEAMKAPVAMAIDGEIYVALADGKILTMQGGKLDKIITPKAVPNQTAPTRLFTNTDVKDIYLLRAEDGTITRISKEGQTIATLKAPPGMHLDKLSGMTVDEAKGKYYLVQGHKVYEATLTGAATTPKTGTAPSDNTSPSLRPTVVP